MERKVALVVLVFVVVFRRHLILGSFDSEFAASIRARPALVDLLLVTMVAVAAIAAFEAVGSIIVIAMFICPAAAARLMTNHLGKQLAWSQLFALISAVVGYWLAGYGLIALGLDMSLSAAGMIATVAGLILLLTCLWGPQRRGRAVLANA